MGLFDWLGQIPPPQAKESNKVLSSPATQKQPQPQYEDKGVAYRGYAKKQIAEGQYVIIPQRTRFFGVRIQNTAGFNNVVARTGADKKIFYCTKLLITFRNIGSFPKDCRISDVTGAAASTRLQWFPPTTEGSIVLDFSDSPREFRGDSFDFYTGSTLGATEWISYQLFGWEEDKS